MNPLKIQLNVNGERVWQRLQVLNVTFSTHLALILVLLELLNARMH